MCPIENEFSFSHICGVSEHKMLLNSKDIDLDIKLIFYIIFANQIKYQRAE